MSSFIEGVLTRECVDAALEGAHTHDRRRGLQVFRAAWFDTWMARASPALPVLLFSPVVAAELLFAARGGRGAPAIAALFAAGVLALTWVEYTFHRHWFHREPGASRAARIDAFLVHGYHHRLPDDATRLVLPPMATIPLAALTFWVFRGGLGPASGAAFHAGFVAGYVAYDTLHWASHHVHARSGPLRWLRRYHLLHHHDPRPLRFGVSSPLWDWVYGTYSPPRREPEATGVDASR